MKALNRAGIHAYLVPLEQFTHQCHKASLSIVRSGLVPGSRVARGTCRGVGGQHSWVVVGDDVYAPNAQIIDPTLWSYDPSVTGVWYGSARDGRHVPHNGRGSIWTWGKPVAPREDPVPLQPKQPLSPLAQMFLEVVGPLDRWGWGQLMQAPVKGWPAGEIIAAMDDTPALSALVPIDLLGMLTDRNPSGLYLP